jgi:conflict system pore-forming effector with SLATT domain
MADQAPNDLGPSERLQLSWERGNVVRSLETLFEYITKEAESAINWYLRQKRSKQNRARLLRFCSIIAGTIAGLIPILGQIFAKNGQPIIQPAWASVALGITAALVLLDRFFGYSSAWMRYIATELNIRQLTQELQLDWEADKATWLGSEPTPDQLRSTLARFKAFVTQVNTIVRQETDAWIQEFQSTLKQIDEAAKAKVAVSELGAVNITVTNGDACDDGWNLSIDQGNPTNHRGKTAGVGDLVPGIHTLKVNGLIGGNPKQAEAAISVTAGGTATAQMTLG